MNKMAIKFFALTTLCLINVGCGTLNKKISTFMTKQDSHYLTSPEGKPLVIPADLHTPQIQDKYVIPVVTRNDKTQPSLVAPDSPSLEMLGKKK